MASFTLKSIQYFLECTTPLGSVARYRRERRLLKKLREWERRGRILPMPHFGKQQVVLDHLRDFNIECFVETGTYKGHMVYAVMRHVGCAYSIEIDPTLCREAQRRFAGYANVNILLGQSGDILPLILERLDQPCLFWLDAHYSGGSTGKSDLDTPILQELDAILNHRDADRDLILIDDARCFTGQGDYPRIETVEAFIMGRQPSWEFAVKDDIIRAHARNRRT